MGRRRRISATPEQAFHSPSFVRFVVTFTALVMISVVAAVGAGNAAVGDHLLSQELLMAHSLFLACLVTLVVDFWWIRKALQRVDRPWLEATIDREQLIPSPRPVAMAVKELLDRAYQHWTGRWCLLFFGAIPISLLGLVAYLTSPRRETGTSLPYEMLFVPVGEFLLVVTSICLFAVLVRRQCQRAFGNASDHADQLYATGRLSSFSDIEALTAKMQMDAATSARTAGAASPEDIFGNDSEHGHVVAANPFGNDGDVAAANPFESAATNLSESDGTSVSPAAENRSPNRRDPFGD